MSAGAHAGLVEAEFHRLGGKGRVVADAGAAGMRCAARSSAAHRLWGRAAKVGPPGGQDTWVGAPERLDRHVRVTEEQGVRSGEVSTRNSLAAAEVSSWASSTTTSRTSAHTLASAAESSSSRSAAAVRIQAGS